MDYWSGGFGRRTGLLVWRLRPKDWIEGLLVWRLRPKDWIDGLLVWRLRLKDWITGLEASAEGLD